MQHVTVTVDGTEHHGTYYVQEKILHARSFHGQKATQLGELSPQSMARIMLLEMVLEAKGK